MAKISVLD